MSTTRRNQPSKYSCQKWISVFTFVFTALVMPAISLAEYRIWTSVDGKTRVSAELVGVDGQMAILKKQSDSTLHRVPLTMLSEADQLFVRQNFKQVPKANGLFEDDNKNTRFNWQTVYKTLPEFKQYMIGSVPAIGKTVGMKSLHKRYQPTGKEDQIGCFLQYHCFLNPLDGLAKDLKEKGSKAAFSNGTKEQNEVRSSQMDYFWSMHSQFASLEEQGRLRKLRRSNTNEFDKGAILSEEVSKFSKIFDGFNVKNREIPLTLITKISIGGYDHNKQEFPITLRSQFTRRYIGGNYGQVDVIYPTPPDKPTAIKVKASDARDFARRLEGVDMRLKKDIVLSKLRSERDTFGGTTMVQIANATVVGLSLVAADDPNKMIYKWKLTPQPQDDSPAPENSVTIQSGDNPLSQKMAEIAKTHRLVTFGGYPVIRTDRRSFSNPHLTSAAGRFSLMLERVALGLDSDYLNPLFIARHFPEAIGRFILASTDGNGNVQRADWKGVGEFERREIQNAFNKAYADKVKDYVIQLPIRFTEVYAVPLGSNGRYDFEREGVFIEHDRYNKTFPEFGLGFNAGKARSIPQLPRPSLVQHFVPIPPTEAKTLFNRPPDSEGNAYVKRVVTWHGLKIDDGQPYTLPPVTVSTGSYELYADPMLKTRLAELEHKEVPPEVLSNADAVVLPGEDRPFDLDKCTMFFLEQEAQGTTPGPEKLQEMFDEYRHRVKDFNQLASTAAFQLAHAEKKYTAFGSARNPGETPRLDTKTKVIEEWKNAKDLASYAFDKRYSSFFPIRADQNRIPPDMLPELARKWGKWMRQCIDSTQRNFVLHADLKIDSTVGDMQVSFHQEKLPDPYGWDFAKSLIESGVEAKRLVILERFGPEISSTPCLQLAKPIEAYTEKIPSELRDKIVKQYFGFTKLDIVITVGKTKHIPTTQKNQLDGLVLESRIKTLRVLDRDGNLLKEIPFSVDENTRPTSNATGDQQKSKTAKMTQSPKPAPTETPNEAQPLTPATILRLVARHLPDDTNRFGRILMFNRWKQEADYRSLSRRGPGQKSPYEVDPNKGMYFQSQASRPSADQLNLESAAFLKWLNEGSATLGTNYTLRLKSRFAPHSDDVRGYRMAKFGIGSFGDAMEFGKVRGDVLSAINLLERRIKISSRLPSGGGSGISIGPNTSKSSSTVTSQSPEMKKHQDEMSKLIKLRDYLEQAVPVIFLKDIQNKFVLTDLRGYVQGNDAIQRSDDQTTQYGKPIHPALRMSHELVLPGSLNIQPDGTEFQIEFEFEIKSATALESPPELYDAKVVGKYREQLRHEDHGNYVLFEVAVRGAWLIDRTGKERLHQLELVPLASHLRKKGNAE